MRATPRLSLQPQEAPRPGSSPPFPLPGGWQRPRRAAPRPAQLRTEQGRCRRQAAATHQPDTGPAMDGGGSHRREPGPRRSAGIRMPERARMRGGRRGPEVGAVPRPVGCLGCPWQPGGLGAVAVIGRDHNGHSSSNPLPWAGLPPFLSSSLPPQNCENKLQKLS